MTDELTAPVEDYLKAIYEIERQAGAAATNELAQRLAIAPPSVTGMVRRLATQGLVDYEPYRGVTLTATGRRAALRTIRRHRIIETYLVQKLAFDWDEVHDEAERLEHAASDELIDRMAAALGEPRTDPHGAPIPTREGAVSEVRERALAELPTGATARVTSVRDDDGELLRYVATLSIRPGATVTVLDRAPFDGPVTLLVADEPGAEGARHVVGATIGRHVFVAAEEEAGAKRKRRG